MKLRSALLAVLVISVVAPAGASGAAKQVCKVLKDRDGDGGARISSYGPLDQNSPPMDVLEGDFATGKKTVVAKVRVKSFDLDVQAFPVAYYYFYFKIGSTNYQFSASRTYDGEIEYEFTHGSVTGKIDEAAGTITWTTSRSNVAALAKTKKVVDLRVATENEISNADNTSVDQKSVYTDRTPSCLKPA